MTNYSHLVLVGAIWTILCATALAHARLDHAIPAVDATVAAPNEIAITFTHPVVENFSGAELIAADGEKIPLGKAKADSSDPKTLRLPVERPLKPGAYRVEWRAVTPDTHRMTGAYRFTVAP